MYFQSQKQFSQVPNDNENEALIITKPERLSIVFVFRWWFLIRNFRLRFCFWDHPWKNCIYTLTWRVYQIPLIVTQTVTLRFDFVLQFEVFKVCYKNKIMEIKDHNFIFITIIYGPWVYGFKSDEVNFRSPVYKQRELTCENHWLKQLCFSRAWLLAVFLFFKCIHSFQIMKSSGIQLPNLF